MSTLDHPQVESSLEGFLKQVRPRLKGVFTRYRIPAQDTEDILQQALIALVYRRESVRDPEWRRRFLSHVPDNARTLELAAQWVGTGRN